MYCPHCGAENEVGADLCVACTKPLASPLTISSGTRIAGRYEVLGPLGSGGMGMVYKAHDHILDETVAIKTLRADVVSDPEVTRRFRSEIKLARKVRHENVCGIHEYNEDVGVRFIVMEYVDGTDLRKLIRERGALPWPEAFDAAIQAARGLEAIHEAGVIHRDLKTSNIMRDVRGVVRLMDFGIAKKHDADVTLRGQLIGTPEYMSPEQAQGQKIDYPTDLYALGIVIFEIFTGRVPFHGESALATILMQIHDAPPLDGPGAERLPAALVPVLRKLLAKSPAERIASASELRRALEVALAETLAGAASDEAAPAPRGTGLEDLIEDEPATAVRAAGIEVGTDVPTLAQPATALARAQETIIDSGEVRPIAVGESNVDLATLSERALDGTVAVGSAPTLLDGGVSSATPRDATWQQPYPSPQPAEQVRPGSRSRASHSRPWGRYAAAMAVAGLSAVGYTIYRSQRGGSRPTTTGPTHEIAVAAPSPIGPSLDAVAPRAPAGELDAGAEPTAKATGTATIAKGRTGEVEVGRELPPPATPARGTAAPDPSRARAIPTPRPDRVPAPPSIAPRTTRVLRTPDDASAPSSVVSPSALPNVPATVAVAPEPTPDPNVAIPLPAGATRPKADPGNRPPSYPAHLLAQGTEGVVLLKLTISATGEVSGVEVLSATDVEFGRAAVEAARTWRYSPALVDGRSQSVFLTVRVPFRSKNDV